MVDRNGDQEVPQRMLDLLRMFLAASSRGEHAVLVLESVLKTRLNWRLDVVPVARLEYFRALKFSRLESFRALNPYCQIGGF